VRLFFALWPPRETAKALGEWASQVAAAAGGRAIAQENIHLTLAFLGEADPRKASAAAARATGKSFELPIDTRKYWKHNKIVWAGPAAMPEELASLVESLHGSLKAKGFVLEERPFAAHITLVRKAGLARDLPELPRVRWPAREFVLVRSTPAGDGSRYDALGSFPLA
jgi:2'-5' RNA ligase